MKTIYTAHVNSGSSEPFNTTQAVEIFERTWKGLPSHHAWFEANFIRARLAVTVDVIGIDPSDRRQIYHFVHGRAGYHFDYEEEAQRFIDAFSIEIAGVKR